MISLISLLLYSRTSIYVLLDIRTFALRTVFLLTYYSIYILEFDIRTLHYVLELDIRTQIQHTYSNSIYVL